MNVTTASVRGLLVACVVDLLGELSGSSEVTATHNGSLVHYIVHNLKVLIVFLLFLYL